MRLLSFVITIAIALDARAADACAIAKPRDLITVPIEIAEEEALIVWDGASKTEHFIRRAAFRSGVPAFGFLVPAPSVPELGEVSDGVFVELGQLLVPEVRTATEGFDLQPVSFIFESCAKSAGDKVTTAARDQQVRVIQTARVAGFDATTVQADDPQALAGWLDSHGFASTPELTAWLARYVSDKWTITAFVVAADAQHGQPHDVATRAVRMSFKTERPFYPYREPDAKTTPTGTSRLLRVYLAADARYAATLAGEPWSAGVVFAGPTDHPSDLTRTAGTNLWITVFRDDNFPRRAIDELYFAKSADQGTVKPPPIIVKEPRAVVIPVDLIAIAAGGGWWYVGRRRRRRVRQRQT